MKQTIFSEIYGAYFRIVSEVLSKQAASENVINDIIIKNGFADSVLFVPQKLLPQDDNSDWGLLRKKDGKLISVLSHKPVQIMTALQKMWLKAILSDPRIRLFMTDEEISKLDKKLDGVKPLFTDRHFHFTDRYGDGDDYSSEEYIQHFRMVLKAAKERKILDIQFTSGHGKLMRGCYLPVKIEYSPKNDKFRTYCFLLKNGEVKKSGIMNIGRIDFISETGQVWENAVDMGDFPQKSHVDIKVTAERNAVERFMMEFASFKKQTDRDLETGECKIRLWYDNQNETEVLIRLLSFGPVLEILGPDGFRKQAAERVKKQYGLLHN
ncbi:MAG: WYL domain-containing protein [Firmicutes bacterium]|nr:WYL domain-containing protein [Bacillota bacterium]